MKKIVLEYLIGLLEVEEPKTQRKSKFDIAVYEMGKFQEYIRLNPSNDL